MEDYERLVKVLDKAVSRAVRRDILMYADPTIRNVRLKRQAVTLANDLLAIAQGTRP